MNAAEILDTGALTETLLTALELSVHDPVNEQAQRQTGPKKVNTWEVPSENGVDVEEHIQTLDEQMDVDRVEQLMCNHESVETAAVVLRDGPDAEVVGFVTLHKWAIEQQIENLGKFR